MMQSATAATAEKKELDLLIENALPLVLEILPGQAGEGLIDIYEPGSYEGISLRELVYKALGKRDRSIEEKQILDDINRQLSGGKVLIRGKEIQGTAREHALLDQTDEGEKYYYVAVRAIKPQEGGISALEFA